MTIRYRKAPSCARLALARSYAGRRVATLRVNVAWSIVRRWIVAVAAMILPASLLHAALPTEPGVSGPTSFAGQLLVASPDLRQAAFDHAVILLAQHSHEGALGIVINRPGVMHPLAGLLSAFHADVSGINGSVRVFFGGPVDPNIALVVHSAEYNRPDTIDIDGRVAMTVAPDVLRDIGLGRGPNKSLVAFGYAGWAPAQLENELAHGVWVTVPEDLGLVFDDDRANVWTDALARHKTVR
jgi:putative transcriptional regulator